MMPSAAGSSDPFELPWAGSGRDGRHALGERAGTVRVDELLAAFASQPHGSQINGASPARGGRRPDDPAGELAAARVEIDRLTAALKQAEGDLDVVCSVGDAELDELRAVFADEQTGWELRVRELEKELEEVSRELAEQLEVVRAEAADLGAEADAAFAELGEAYAALNAAEARLAAVDTTRRGSAKGVTRRRS